MHILTHHSKAKRGQRAAAPRRGAFTLIELLVVMGIMLVLVVTTLPAFKAIQKSGRLSGATNAVTTTLNNARAQAVREGRDVAVMFRFDIQRQVCSMELVRAEATVYDADRQPNPSMNAATVFVSIKGQAPIDLPRGAGVFGLGYGASRDQNNQIDTYNWYEDLETLFGYSVSIHKDPWLFPRTDVRVFSEGNPPTDGDVQLLDTFIVRFSPDGSVVSNAEELGSLAKEGDGFLDIDAPDSREYRVWNPEIKLGNFNNVREKTIHAEYQLRSVPMLVVVDLFEMGNDLGLREPWMVVGDGMPTSGKYMNANGDQTPLDQIEINDWIDLNASPISFNRFTGELMRDIKR